jgi:enterochelin esterase family protein
MPSIAARLPSYTPAILLELAREPTLVETFWRRLERERTPLIEPDEQHPGFSLVTFVWRTTPPEDFVVARQNWGSAGDHVMTRIAGTDVCYASYRIRDDYRGTYQFSIAPPLRPWPSPSRDESTDSAAHERALPTRHDPLHREHYALNDPSSGEPSLLRSVVSLPAAPDQAFSRRREGVPRGALASFRLAASRDGQERPFWIYTPHGYTESNRRLPLLIVLDGGVYLSLHGARHTLDNLIAAAEMAPAIAVFLESTTPAMRDKEMLCDPRLPEFLELDLLPWLADRYRVTSSADARYVAGVSGSGVASLWVGLRLPHLFQNVVSQAAALWWGPGADTQSPLCEGTFRREWLVDEYERATVLPRHVWLEVGALEHPHLMLAPIRRLHSLLLTRGIEVVYSEPAGGHEYALWRGTFGDALRRMISPGLEA